MAVWILETVHSPKILAGDFTNKQILFTSKEKDVYISIYPNKRREIKIKTSNGVIRITHPINERYFSLFPSYSNLIKAIKNVYDYVSGMYGIKIDGIVIEISSKNKKIKGNEPWVISTIIKCLFKYYNLQYDTKTLARLVTISCKDSTSIIAVNKEYPFILHGEEIEKLPNNLKLLLSNLYIVILSTNKKPKIKVNAKKFNSLRKDIEKTTNKLLNSKDILHFLENVNYTQKLLNEVLEYPKELKDIIELVYLTCGCAKINTSDGSIIAFIEKSDRNTLREIKKLGKNHNINLSIKNFQFFLK